MRSCLEIIIGAGGDDFRFYTDTIWTDLSILDICPNIGTLMLGSKGTSHVLGIMAEWSKVLIAVPWPLRVWSTLVLGTYLLRFVSWVFHVIFSFAYFTSFETLCALGKPFGIRCVFIQSLDCKSYINILIVIKLPIICHYVRDVKLDLLDRYISCPFSMTQHWAHIV